MQMRWYVQCTKRCPPVPGSTVQVTRANWTIVAIPPSTGAGSRPESTLISTSYAWHTSVQPAVVGDDEPEKMVATCRSSTGWCDVPSVAPQSPPPHAQPVL